MKPALPGTPIIYDSAPMFRRDDIIVVCDGTKPDASGLYRILGVDASGSTLTFERLGWFAVLRFTMRRWARRAAGWLRDRPRRVQAWWRRRREARRVVLNTDPPCVLDTKAGRIKDLRP